MWEHLPSLSIKLSERRARSVPIMHAMSDHIKPHKIKLLLRLIALYEANNLIFIVHQLLLSK